MAIFIRHSEFSRHSGESRDPVQAPPALRLRVADTFISRFFGLMLRAPLASDEGLLITGCRCIHTAWMRYAIDLAYLDRSGTVLHCVPHLKPWRASFGPRRSVHVLELPAGGLATHHLQAGQRIEHPDLLRRSRR